MSDVRRFALYTRDSNRNYWGGQMQWKLAILRGFQSMPLLRYVSKSDGRLLVRSERSYTEWLNGRGWNDWIGWPKNETAFEYDESVFNRLDALYRRGAKTELENEWGRCQVFGGN